MTAASHHRQQPVKIDLSVEGFGDGRTETVEVARDEWDAMIPGERFRYAERCSTEFATNHVGWGWKIAQPDDRASTTVPAATEDTMREIIDQLAQLNMGELLQVKAKINQLAARERETVWCEAHGGFDDPHFERGDCRYPHFTDQATRARLNAARNDRT